MECKHFPHAGYSIFYYFQYPFLFCILAVIVRAKQKVEERLTIVYLPNRPFSFVQLLENHHLARKHKHECIRRISPGARNRKDHEVSSCSSVKGWETQILTQLFGTSRFQSVFPLKHLHLAGWSQAGFWTFYGWVKSVFDWISCLCFLKSLVKVKSCSMLFILHRMFIVAEGILNLDWCLSENI